MTRIRLDRVYLAAGLIAMMPGKLAFSQFYTPSYLSGGYGWDSGASTAQESYARGLADVIRARSEAQLYGAQATTEMEQARRAYIQNRNLAAESFVERRRLRDEYRETADNTFYKSKEKLAAYVEGKKTQPLSSSEFDPTSGDLSWPYVLSLPEDQDRREQITRAFEIRAKEGGLDPSEVREASNLIVEWRNALSDRTDEFSMSELASAARFLNRLNAELKTNL